MGASILNQIAELLLILMASTLGVSILLMLGGKKIYQKASKKPNTVLYPIVNLIILKLTGLLLGGSFVISGWILAFFIAIFISIMTLILKKIVVRIYKEGR